MIKAVLFDLDGTLVKTEELKSQSYYQAIQAISLRPVACEEVEAAYQVVVGRPRQEVAAHMVERFELDVLDEGNPERRPARQVLMQLYVEAYEKMLADEELMRNSLWPCTVDLLYRARQRKCHTALASMSTKDQVDRILKVCQLSGLFDLVLTREMVRRAKPDPEVYQLAAHILGLLSTECLVIEDSAIGVQAALDAGMCCVAVANSLTGQSLRALHELPSAWLVEEPSLLVEMVDRLFFPE